MGRDIVADVHPHELASPNELTSPRPRHRAAESSRDAVLAGVSAADSKKASILAAAAIARSR